MRAYRSFFLVLVCWWLLAVAPRPALAGDEALCVDALKRVEALGRVPRGLLSAVALSESGHKRAGGGAFAPWPWTVNNAGDGRYFSSKAEAVAWVERLRAEGRRNIDVGCMQVNLMHHPDAFADLQQALDPLANVSYGADFLASLQAETGSWDRAVERYHTAEPERGEAYRSRVYAHWGGGLPEVRVADRGVAANGKVGDDFGRRLPVVLGPRPAPAASGMVPIRLGPRFLPIGAGHRGSGGLQVRSLASARPSGSHETGEVLRSVPGAFFSLPRQRVASVQVVPAPGGIAVMTGFLVPARAVGSLAGGHVRTVALPRPASKPAD